ncbi:MAG: glycosyltransferase [Crocinitomicaceae bacterium]|nr:glycosyltransferase [Crocinitomicaceae bacterium]
MRKSAANPPLVSVIMITYMHEAFIAQAIEGVLMQEVDFPVELIIADDCSPDQTSQIIKTYIETHPNGHWIRYTRHERNKGMMPNFVWALEQASGKYIALCEGDDYWIDKSKLSRQRDFMNANSGFSFCFSNISHVDEYKNALSINWPDRNENFVLTRRMLGEEYLIPSPTIFFVSSCLKIRSMEKLETAPLGDYVLSSLLLMRGHGFYCPYKMATYRHHKNGVFSELELKEKVREGLETRRILFRFFIGKARLVSALILFKNSRIFKKRYPF